MNPLRSILTRHFQASNLSVFETEVGAKYRFGRFDSRKFDDHVMQEMPFPLSELSFSNLVLPPDLLRDRYTLCGTRLRQSPHFRLMEEIETGTLAEDSEYVSRRKRGTLDARLPRHLEIRYLTERYWLRKKDLVRNRAAAVSVIRVSVGGESKYVIADGKHRAAMAAYLDRPEYLHLQLLSNAFAQDPFFQQVYSYALGLAFGEYSINQEMIRAILDGS